LNVGDERGQAAACSFATSIPSVSITPRTTFGNWFCPSGTPINESLVRDLAGGNFIASLDDEIQNFQLRSQLHRQAQRLPVPLLSR
jgi:hypothetical protein